MASLSKHGVAVHIDELLEAKELTLTQISELVDVTVVNLPVLKNGRAKAVRFSTLAALCRALDCHPFQRNTELLDEMIKPPLL
jgi:putative transcriptional regulator